MNATASIERGRFQGVAQILAFNRGWYGLGFTAIAAVLVFLVAFDPPTPLRVAILAGASVALTWSVASLAVSHWVYDRSRLCRWDWIREALSSPPARWLHLHCGLDESSAALRRLLGGEGMVLDIFDSNEMPERSIRRARRRAAGQESALNTLQARHDALPLDDGSVDAVFLLFAAHELRRPIAREALLSEVRRTLRVGGEAVVAEHLRDPANFAAFGPGAFHFFSGREWRRVFRTAGLSVRRETRITPFVRVFVLRREG